MNNWKYLVIGALLGALVFLAQNLWKPIIDQVLSAFTPGAHVSNLIILRPNPAIGLDPARLTDQESLRVTANIFETLVRYDNKGEKIISSLAESWKSSDDGRIWQFKLRSDVRFQDGSMMDAESIVFNFHRWMDEDNPYHTGTFNYWSASFGYDEPIITRVEALDNQSVQITLSEPYAPFLETLALPSFGIASPQAIKTYNDSLMYNPVGTGPFVLDAWNSGNLVHLTAFKQYWGKKPLANALTFEMDSSESSRLNRLTTKEAHIAEGISKLPEVKGIQLISRPYNNVGYLALNNEHPLLAIREVREGIAMAINRQKLIETAFEVDTRLAVGFVPPVIWGYHENLVQYMPSFEPNLAKQRLQAYNGREFGPIRLLVMSEPRSYFPNPEALAQALKNDLESVGLDIVLEVRSWKEVIERGKIGDYDLLLAGWVGDIADPDNYLYTLFSSENANIGNRTNYAAYRNQAIDTLLKRARQTYNTTYRAELYREIQEIIAFDLPLIPLIHTSPKVAVSEDVEGYFPSFVGDDRLDQVAIRQVRP